MIFVDSDVILDVVTRDALWYAWSIDQIRDLSHDSSFVINSIVYAEVSMNFDQIEVVEKAIPAYLYRREVIPAAACFLAGHTFKRYKMQPQTQQLALPDFFIGAHAAVKNYHLLTRNVNRYTTYFPTVQLIHP